MKNNKLKLIKKYFLVIGMATLTSHVLGQQSVSSPITIHENIIPTSPNAASLGIFGAVPVSPYTGVPQIDVPIYEIELDGQTIPIRLSYHASGLKAAQDASWVGLGWGLNAGGCITADIRHLDDFGLSQKNSAQFGYARYKVPSTSDKNYITTVHRITDGMDKVDVEPDIFHFNFGNHSGSMFFENESLKSDGTAKPMMRKQGEYLDVTFDMEKNSWMIMDGYGYKYYFITKEITDNYSGDLPGGGQYGGIVRKMTKQFNEHLPFDRLGNPYHYTAWMLDSIVSQMGNKITFTYEQDTISTPMAYTEKTAEIMGLGDIPGRPTYPPTDPPLSHYKGGTYSYSNIIQQRVKEITFPGGKIKFETTDREDIDKGARSLLAGKVTLAKPAQKLSKVKIYNNSNSKIKELLFEYDYKEDNKALFLYRITEPGNGRYEFKYNPMISRQRKEMLHTDYWGYYNHRVRSISDWGSPRKRPDQFGTFTPAMLYDDNNKYSFFWGANRTSYFTGTLEGVLEYISYPTLGRTFFYYELNDFDNFSYPEYSYPKLLDIKREKNGDEYVNNTKVNEIKLTVENDEIIFITAWANSDQVRPNNNREFDDHFMLYIRKKGSNNQQQAVLTHHINRKDSRGNSKVNEWDRKQYNLSAGEYYIDFSNEVYSQQAKDRGYSFTIGIETLEAKEHKQGAGLRIKSIQYPDGVKKEYTYKKDGKSSGLLMASPQYLKHLDAGYDFQQVELVKYTWDGLMRYPVIKWGYTKWIRYAVVSNNSYTPLTSSAGGSHVGYSYVEEITKGKNNQYLGKIAYTFENKPDELVDEKGYFTMGLPTLPQLLNGAILKEEVYDKNNKLVKKTENTYTRRKHNQIKGLNLTKIQPNAARVIDTPYYLDADWWVKSKEKTTEYLNGNSIVNEVTYNYNAHNFLLYTMTTKNSKKETCITTYQYPTGSTTGMPDYVTKLKEKGLLCYPLEEKLTINTKVAQAKKYSYMEDGNKMLLSKIHTLESDELLSPASYVDYLTQEIISIEKYNKFGKPIQLTNKEGISIVYFWNHNSQYPAAEIKNATIEDIKNKLGPLTLEEMLATGNLTVHHIGFLNSLRSLLPHTEVTTYTYKPLVGMLSVTDPSGKTLYYDYDQFNRLKRIYTKEDNVTKTIQTFEYKYSSKDLLNP